MIKYFCDNCQTQVGNQDQLFAIVIPWCPCADGSCYACAKHINICFKCLQKLHKLYGKKDKS